MDIHEMKTKLDEAEKMQNDVVANLVEQVKEYGNAMAQWQLLEFCTRIMQVLDDFEDDCNFG